MYDIKGGEVELIIVAYLLHFLHFLQFEVHWFSMYQLKDLVQIN